MYQLASGQPARPSEQPSDIGWSRLWRSFLRRRRAFAVVAAGTFIIIAAYTFVSPPRYTTHVKLIAGNGQPTAAGGDANTTLPLLNALLAATGAQTSETYAELFQESPVANQVISDLSLPMTAGELLGHVKVTPVINTTLLDLAITWSNPDMAAKVANSFAGAFVEHERMLVGAQADQAITTLAVQLPKAQAAAAAAESALATFQSQNNMADLQTTTQNTMNAAAAIDAKINATEVDRSQVAAQLKNINAQLASVGKSVPGQTSTAPNPVLGQLQTQLAQVSVQLQVAQQQYTDKHPTVIGLRRQEAELQREIDRTSPTVVAQANTMPNPVYEQLQAQAATVSGQVAADSAMIAQLQAQHAAMRPELSSLPGKATRLLDLQRQAKLAGDVLNALQQKVNEANISKTTALSDVTITAPASAADATVTPNRTMNLILGAFVSIVLGAIVTLLSIVFDRRIRDERQIEEELELPVLASVPMLGGLRNHLSGITGSPAPDGSAGPAAMMANVTKEDSWLRAFAVESFLQLVTSLRYSTTQDRRLRCVTITSCAQGDGKSTIALNTAIAMAHVEPRVLLIDGDLRRPSLHAKLNRELGLGLTDVLVGTADINDVITPTTHEGLDLLMSGTRTPNSVKLIQSDRFDDILSGLLERYQTVIIDAPALNPVIDAAILATKSDGTVLVVSIDSSDSLEVQRAVSKLQSVGVTNIVGTVANRVQPSRRVLDEDYFAFEAPAIQPALHQ
jgi:capsular exopolysaccharide synthesis family protein